MSRARRYATDAERQAAFRARRRQERLELLARAAKPARHERHAFDHYVSPIGAVRAGLRLAENPAPAMVLDPSAGDDARWVVEAQHRWPAADGWALELRNVPQPRGIQHWYSGVSFLKVAPQFAGLCDLVIGNPPFALMTEFIEAGLDCLRDGGELIYLGRTNFREGRARNAPDGLFSRHPLYQQAVCIERIRFYGFGSGLTSMSFFHWRKGWRGTTKLTSVSIEDGEAGG